MDRVGNKVAIITGAANGMGKADAMLLAAQGAKVILTDVDELAGRDVAEKIGGNALFLRHDVTSEEDWKSVVAVAVEKYGRLDVLVNNAGIMFVDSLPDIELERFRLVNKVNSEGVFLGCKHSVPAMAASGGGSIINMSSVAAISGIGFALAYSASKGAVTSMTRSVAMYCRDQGNGVRCNSIHPDGVRTPMTARVFSGKDEATQEDLDALAGVTSMCEPEDIANMVLYLASDESRFVNGAQMLIDNGSTITPPISI